MKKISVFWVVLVALTQPVVRAQPASAGAPQGRVAIEMVSAGAGPVLGERYVALVRSGDRWREPTAEALIPSGEPIPEMTVEPGWYRLLCSEEDHWWAHGPEFEVPPGKLVQRRCEMRPLASLSGKVVAATGDSGVADARVGHVHGFLDDFGLKLSSLGESHRKSLRTTTADGEGSFALRGPANGRVPLWFEANGYSPRHLELVRFPGGSGTLGEVELEEGGALRLLLSYRGELDLNGYAVTLVPAGVVPVGERSWVRLTEQLWAKAIPSSRPAELQWPSLPARRLEVWLVPEDLRSLRVLPRRLGEVTVEVGRQTTARLEVPPDLDGGEPPSREETGSTLRLRVAGSGLLGPFTLRRWDGGWEAVAGLVQAGADETTTVVVPAGCRPGETYILETSSLVSEPLGLTPSDCEGEVLVSVSLFPSGWVEGRFLAPEKASPPATTRIAVAPCEGESLETSPSGVLPTALGEGGTWQAWS